MKNRSWTPFTNNLLVNQPIEPSYVTNEKNLSKNLMGKKERKKKKATKNTLTKSQNAFSFSANLKLVFEVTAPNSKLYQLITQKKVMVNILEILNYFLGC